MPKADSIRGNGLNTHAPHVPNGGNDDGVLDEPDDTGWTLRKRIAAADDLLKGKPTKSQIDSVRIGLARHAGTHPAIDSMLARLKKAER